MGMTWRVKVRGLVVVVASLAALATASGADWTDMLFWLRFW